MATLTKEELQRIVVALEEDYQRNVKNRTIFSRAKSAELIEKIRKWCDGRQKKRMNEIPHSVKGLRIICEDGFFHKVSEDGICTGCRKKITIHADYDSEHD